MTETLLIRSTNQEQPKGIVYLSRKKGVLTYDILATIYADKTIVFEANDEGLSESVLEQILNISKSFNVIYNSLKE